MKVVLDTNIAIGAVTSLTGPPAQILTAWRNSSFTWVTSPGLLAELRRALAYPRVQRYSVWSAERVALLLADIENEAMIVAPTGEIAVVERDLDDNRVVEAAVAGEADYIVTNDNDLLVLGNFEGIEIVTAARFLGVLELRRQRDT